jgi:hypothetical protein
MLHPCFYGNWASRSNSDDQGPGIAYFSPRKISQKFDVDGMVSPEEVTSYHRLLEFYAQSFRDAGLWITDLQEPHPTEDQFRDDAWWQACFLRPIFSAPRPEARCPASSGPKPVSVGAQRQPPADGRAACLASLDP